MGCACCVSNVQLCNHVGRLWARCLRGKWSGHRKLLSPPLPFLFFTHSLLDARELCGSHINVVTYHPFQGLKAAHTQIGTAVCWAMAIQPILGWLHHRYYLKHNTRGAISHGHIWYGRALMLFGLINVGLGLQLVGGSTMLMTLFAIMAAVVGAFYISIKLFKLMIKRNAAQSEEVQIRRIPSIVKDPRWDGSINEVEMTRYGISRGQGVTVKRI